MMEAGRCVEIFDLYEWLPGYGENSIEIRAVGMDLSVTVQYDGEFGELQKKINFKHVTAFYKSSFPGPNLLDLQYSVQSPTSIGALTEYPDSKAAQAWTQHFQGLFDVKHYSITFLAENIRLVVFATDVNVQDVIE